MKRVKRILAPAFLAGLAVLAMTIPGMMIPDRTGGGLFVRNLYGSFQEGRDLFRKGDYYGAEEQFLRDQELRPSYLDNYYMLGLCYLYTGRYREALDVSNRGIEISTQDGRLFSNAGRAYFFLNRFNDAISNLERSVSLNSNSNLTAITYYYMGRSYMNMGRYILAETSFSAAILLQGDNSTYYRYRGEVYEKMEDYESAEEDYKKALTLKPNDPNLKESLIRVISRQTEQPSGLIE
jgi:tetratricopeptide (TPR) repeat protein